MIALIWMPTRVLFILLMAAALLLAPIDATCGFDIPLCSALLAGAAASWLVVAVIDFLDRKGLDLRLRLSSAASEGIGGLFILFPSVVVLCAPAYFLLTGALWSSLIVGAVALAISMIITPPIL